ncbi:6848_t:CDS:2 [Funneliformis geosporum]|uniref:Histone H1 n=1 Tax=Funneliformis geosporum TaxID=1117311 RepID=A0A9W4SZ39_9GLOM|nr:19548_t:CDS:2 [Funneliformis geosporum]CAI2186416.1 6848_t:CDS:2 [Funneliformis geosporum]
MNLDFAKFYHQQKLLDTETVDLEIIYRYQVIQDAIIALKEPDGSKLGSFLEFSYVSKRQAIKQFLVNTYKLPDNSSTNKRFRVAINKGIEKGIFCLPQGPTGPVKLTKDVKIQKEEE